MRGTTDQCSWVRQRLRGILGCVECLSVPRWMGRRDAGLHRPGYCIEYCVHYIDQLQYQSDHAGIYNFQKSGQSRLALQEVGWNSGVIWHTT